MNFSATLLVRDSGSQLESSLESDSFRRSFCPIAALKIPPPTPLKPRERSKREREREEGTHVDGGGGGSEGREGGRQGATNPTRLNSPPFFSDPEEAGGRRTDPRSNPVEKNVEVEVLGHCAFLPRVIL